MFWLKSCPRCGGDLYDERDQYGRYISCVQCGHYLTMAEEVVLRYGPKTDLSRTKTMPREAVGSRR